MSRKELSGYSRNCCEPHLRTLRSAFSSQVSTMVAHSLCGSGAATSSRQDSTRNLVPTELRGPLIGSWFNTTLARGGPSPPALPDRVDPSIGIAEHHGNDGFLRVHTQCRW